MNAAPLHSIVVSEENGRESTKVLTKPSIRSMGIAELKNVIESSENPSQLFFELVERGPVQNHLLKALLDMDLDPNCRNAQGETVLGKLLKHPYNVVSSVMILTDRSNSHPALSEYASANGNTALHDAFLNAQLESIRYLCTPLVVYVPNNENQKPLDLVPKCDVKDVTRRRRLFQCRQILTNYLASIEKHSDCPFPDGAEDNSAYLQNIGLSFYRKEGAGSLNIFADDQAIISSDFTGAGKFLPSFKLKFKASDFATCEELHAVMKAEASSFGEEDEYSLDSEFRPLLTCDAVHPASEAMTFYAVFRALMPWDGEWDLQSWWASMDGSMFEVGTAENNRFITLSNVSCDLNVSQIKFHPLRTTYTVRVHNQVGYFCVTPVLPQSAWSSCKVMVQKEELSCGASSSILVFQKENLEPFQVTVDYENLETGTKIQYIIQILKGRVGDRLQSSASSLAPSRASSPPPRGNRGEPSKLAPIMERPRSTTNPENMKAPQFEVAVEEKPRKSMNAIDESLREKMSSFSRFLPRSFSNKEKERTTASNSSSKNFQRTKSDKMKKDHEETLLPVIAGRESFSSHSDVGSLCGDLISENTTARDELVGLPPSKWSCDQLMEYLKTHSPLLHTTVVEKMMASNFDGETLVRKHNFKPPQEVLDQIGVSGPLLKKLFEKELATLKDIELRFVCV